MVQLGQTLTARTDETGRRHHAAAPRRHPCLVRLANRQRPDRHGKAVLRTDGINSLVQAAKAKARGYRSLRNLKAITYRIAGKLDLRLPT